jgi:hypothetical protein
MPSTGGRLMNLAAVTLDDKYRIEHVVARLDAGRLDAAVALADAPAMVRGFGPVRRAIAEVWRASQRALLQRFDAAGSAVGSQTTSSPAARAAVSTTA